MDIKENGKVISIKIGRYGVYMQGLDSNTNLPDEYIPSEINFDDASEILKKKSDGPLEICNSLGIWRTNFT